MLPSRLLLMTFILASFLSACGGGSGGEESTSPPDVTPPTPPVASCVNPHSADYPDSYNGKFSIPSPRGELSSHITRGISFKDYSPVLLWSALGQNNQGDCSQDEYVKLMYLQALQAMKASGTQRAWLYNYGRWNSENELWVVEEKDYQIPKKYVD